MPKANGTSDPLPYLQIDRAAHHRAALLASALGVTVQHAIGSLVSWWVLYSDPRTLQAILEETPEGQEPAVIVSDSEVRRGFKSSSGHAIEPDLLEGLGFLERAQNGWRVRGMSRYFPLIRTRTERVKAGKLGGKASVAARRQAKGSARPEQTLNRSELAQASFKQTRTSERSKLEPASEANSNQEAEANFNLEYRVHSTDTIASTSSTRSRGGEKGTAKQPSDPRHQPLVAALVAAGASFEPRNARDVTRLLALATQAVGHEGAHEEVLARWRRALGRSGYPTVRALNELATHWGHFAAPRDTTLSDWSNPQQTPDANGDVKF